MEAVRTKRYFIMRDGRQAGPFTVEQLAGVTITPETAVWNEEAFDWKRADTFQELKMVLGQPPPVVHRGPLHWLRIGRKRKP